MDFSYMEDWAEKKERLNAFWEGKSIGRPFVCVTANKEKINYLSYTKSFREKIMDYGYRIKNSEEEIRHTYYGGEATPCVWPDFGPDFTSACIGGDLVIGERSVDSQLMGSIWAKHVKENWDSDLPNIRFNENGVWLSRGLEFTKKALLRGQGKYLIESLDIDGGLDTAAGLRGAERLCVDLLDCPDNVGLLLDRIREGNKQVINILHSLVDDHQGGMVNTYKIYAPGKSYNMRSDFSYMVNPGLFREFALPYMIKESETVDYIIFHTHTEDAWKNFTNRLKYLDVICDVPRIHAVEWTCPNTPIDIKIVGIRKIIGKGKIALTSASTDEALELAKLLGNVDSKRIMFLVNANSIYDAEKLISDLEKIHKR